MKIIRLNNRIAITTGADDFAFEFGKMFSMYSTLIFGDDLNQFEIIDGNMSVVKKKLPIQITSHKNSLMIRVGIEKGDPTNEDKNRKQR